MSKLEIQFLQGIEFNRIYQAFVKAFSDYIVPMQLSEDQFREMMTRRGANFPLSVGAFVDGELSAFNINAFDAFAGIPTVYDVITGVIPSQRKKGIATNLFQFSLPRLRQSNASRYLLEVIATNRPAIATYERIGFQGVRRLQAFNRKLPVQPQMPPPEDLHLREVELSWETARSFWDWEPSWQNSIASIGRSRAKKTVLGAFIKEKLVGYGIVYPGTGDIPQFAIDRGYRGRGVGAHLIDDLQKRLTTTSAARVVNVDAADPSTTGFLTAIGFDPLTSQHEMELRFGKD